MPTAFCSLGICTTSTLSKRLSMFPTLTLIHPISLSTRSMRSISRASVERKSRRTSFISVWSRPSIPRMWSKRTAEVMPRSPAGDVARPVRGGFFDIYAESIRSMGGHRSSDFYPVATLQKDSGWTSPFSSSWSHVHRSMHG